MIEDYAASSGRTRENMAQVSGQQPGDPARAAQAMIRVVETAHSPLRLAQVAHEVDTRESNG